MEGKVVVEAGVPVDDSAVVSIIDQSDLQLQSLPAGRYVTVTHYGHVDQLKDANAALMTWAAEQDITWDMSIADDGQHWACRARNLSDQPMRTTRSQPVENCYRYEDNLSRRSLLTASQVSKVFSNS
ncbi:MAG: hypothetical protein ACXWZ2_15145 [Mycobacterium sp.]